jgi:hypothetical protein
MRELAMLRTVSVATMTAVHAEQLSSDPLPTPIEATRDVIVLGFTEFAKIPDVEGGEAPRLMFMVDEPGTQQFFVSTMRGMLYSISYDGKAIAPYLDVNAAKWGVSVQFSGPERGLQSVAFHPQFAERGKPGYGKLYTYTDTTNTAAPADFVSSGQSRTHDTVLLEWTAKDPHAPFFDGEAPRELFRAAHPYPNHNGGQIAFNPLAKPGEEDYGVLYVGFADGGLGGDPMNLAQNLSSAFGKVLRIDPLAANSANKKYGIPASNPFANDSRSDTLAEIYAYGVRNPQRFTWDAKDGRIYLADIGQSQVEEISPVPRGANLGWNQWEGSYKYVNRQVDLEGARSGQQLTWPIVEYDHKDPLLQRSVAVTGIAVYRDQSLPQLRDSIIFGDIPSGEIFYVKADQPLNGGHGAIRRILLDDGGSQKTLLQVMREKSASQGRAAATRVDLRFGFGRQGQVFLLNKRDGIIRQLVGKMSKDAAVAP